PPRPAAPAGLHRRLGAPQAQRPAPAHGAVQGPVPRPRRAGGAADRQHVTRRELSRRSRASRAAGPGRSADPRARGRSYPSPRVGPGPGVWPDPGPAAQVPAAYFLGAVGAGAAAWAAAAPIRHGLGEQLAAARAHPAVIEAYRLAATAVV